MPIVSLVGLIVSPAFHLTERYSAVDHVNELFSRGADSAEALTNDLGIEVLQAGTSDRSRGAHIGNRQREALAAAWEAGYYELAREGDIEAVAGTLDCATSTASDLLRRAQRQLVATTLDEQV